MNTEEIVEKYKSAPLISRFALVTVVGLVWPGYYYSEESKVVEESVSTETAKVNEARGKLGEQKKAKTQIPGKEAALDKADQKINEIRKSLPPSYEVHEVLRQVELVAQKNEIKMTAFNPPGNERGGSNMYQEMQFKLSVRGKFIQVTRFVDDLLHFETLTRVTSVTYAPISLLGGGRGGPQLNDTGQSLASIVAFKKDSAGVTAEIDFSVFKSVGI